jgi:ATP-dependent DNA helicase RecG
MEFTLGDIYTDAGILKEASQAADKLLREDYGLDQPSHKGLRQRLEVYMDAQIEKISL